MMNKKIVICKTTSASNMTVKSEIFTHLDINPGDEIFFELLPNSHTALIYSGEKKYIPKNDKIMIQEIREKYS